MDAATLFAHVAVLQAGDPWPADLYLLDYADGAAPAWTVAAREELGAGGVQLTLQDPGNRDLFEAMQLVVLAFPAKTLRTAAHLASQGGAGRLCDLRQQQRYASKRGWR